MNGYTAVPFCSIEPVKVSVASVGVGSWSGQRRVLELDPHPTSHNTETIENAAQEGRTTEASRELHESTLVLRPSIRMA